MVFVNHTLNAFRRQDKVYAYCIYTDFSKAFDQVNYAVLVKVLTDYGIGEPLLPWFKSYLLNRQQRVKLLIHRVKSKIAVPSSGVPQGEI